MIPSITSERQDLLRLDVRDVTLQDILVRIRKQWPRVPDAEIYFPAQVRHESVFEIRIRRHNFPFPETRSQNKEISILGCITFDQILSHASHCFPGKHLSELRIGWSTEYHSMYMIAPI